jgi:hypothetical protein
MPEIPDYFFQYHKRGEHIVTFIIMNQETGATSYYQYINTDGYWYILKSVRVAAVVTYTYTVPVNTDAAAGWIARAGLDYLTPDSAFGE